MTLHAKNPGRPVIAITVLAAAGGLILSGCHSSSSTSAAATQTAGTQTAGTQTAGTQPAGTQAASTQPSGTAVAASPAGSSGAIVSSGSLPFPTTPGDTWVYSNTNGATSENKVVSVTQVASGQQVLMATSLKDNGVTQSSKYSYIVQPNGQIALPFNQFNPAASGVTVKLVAGGAYWPSASQLATGQPYHSTLTMEFTIAGKTEQIAAHITATGGGTQSVTVPAGTFSATVVNELETEVFDGVNVSTEIKTWLANGVGPVQSEIVGIEGGTQSIVNKEELTSFVKG